MRAPIDPTISARHGRRKGPPLHPLLPLTHLGVRQFARDVEMPHVSGVLLHDVEKDPLQVRCIRLIHEATSGTGTLVQPMRLDDGARAFPLGYQASKQWLRILIGREPAVPVRVAPRLSNVRAYESPLEPPTLHERQVIDEATRRPPRRDDGPLELRPGEIAGLGPYLRAKEIQIAKQQRAQVVARGRLGEGSHALIVAALIRRRRCQRIDTC